MEAIPQTNTNGIWRVFPSPAVTEIIAQSGFDFQILDCEHGQYDYQTLYADAVACEAHGCEPWIRVSGTDKVEVQRCLDLGAAAIVFPGLEKLEDFERCAGWMDYAPVGNRGFNPFVRSGQYGMPVEAENQKKPLYVPIIETLSAVEDLDTILKNPRIDLIYIGTYDLSAQLGVAGQMEHEKVLDTVAHILSCAKNNRTAVGAMALDKTKEQNLRTSGVDAIVHGVESHRIKQCFSAMTGIGL